jgi:hypothetical protein
VQVHRGHIMKKMQADSFATLVRQASKLQLKISSTSTLMPDTKRQLLVGLDELEKNAHTCGSNRCSD